MAADKNKKVKQAIALEYDPADIMPGLLRWQWGRLRKKL